MRIHAFTTTLLTALVLCLAPAAHVAAHAGPAAATNPATSGPASVGATDEGEPPPPTINDFLPEQRSLGDCLGALQRPNCGSEARGGWAQTTVFLAIVAGLGFIAWRIVASARRARRDQGRGATPGAVRAGTPDATTARDGDDGVPAP